MKLRIDKSFEKDTDEIADRKLLASIAECIKDVKSFSILSDIKNCRKLKEVKLPIELELINTVSDLNSKTRPLNLSDVCLATRYILNFLDLRLYKSVFKTLCHNY